MIDFFTYFVYCTLLLVLIFLANLRNNKNHDSQLYIVNNNFKIEYFFSIAFISIIVGFRFEVGNDWFGYVNDFNYAKLYSSLKFTDQYYEFGYFYLQKFFHQLGLSYQWMFFTIAFISWYFLYNSLPNKLIPLFIFFVFANEYFFWSMNGIRQFVSLSIFVFSIKYILSREKYYYLLCISIACLFHYSSFLLFIFYLIPLKYNRNLFLSLFIISFFVGTTDIITQLSDGILTFLDAIIPGVGIYLRYFTLESLSTFDSEINYGLGYAFIVIVNFLIILSSKKVIKKYSSSKIYFLIFTIGAIIFNLSSNIFIIGRFNTYLLFIKTIVLAYTVLYFWNFKKYKFFVIIGIFFFLFFFLISIYNSSNMSSPYQFKI